MSMIVTQGGRQVSKEKKGKAVDAGCRNLTASWVRERAAQAPNDVELCDYYEVVRAPAPVA
jgi:DNA excision repair protein ERCC-2